MGRVVLFCQETPGLRLGPGLSFGATPAAGEEYLEHAGQIAFYDGIAEFDSKDFPNWRSWALHEGSPHIEILEEDEQ